ncbi:hypothetical protein V6N13_056141 [Hibiscus sabdariffa]
MRVNANHSRDCEKVTVLISTKQVKKIDKVIEMEVGDKIFEVGVVELGFLDDSDTTSEQENNEVVGDHRSCSGTEGEALNVMCAEKDLNKCMDRELENIRGQINVDELMGGISNKIRNLGSKIEAHSLRKSWVSIMDAHFNSSEYNVENNSERCESLREGENAKDLFEDLELWKVVGA